MAHLEGIRLKKKYGQHFLQDESVVHGMLDAVKLSSSTSVFEIGCGEGFLTRRILATNIARLWVFEIDADWASYVQKTLKDERLHVMVENFLGVDLNPLQEHAPWTVLANLPYQVTFPILYRFKEHSHLLAEGVIMVQEEVAQKIVKKSGRGYGFISLYFQWFFEWRLLQKVPPTKFYPPPKVDSRLLYFKPRVSLPEIPRERDFWRFIKVCFRQPRRTLRNNFAQSHYSMEGISEQMLGLRAQQLKMQDFLTLWDTVSLTPASMMAHSTDAQNEDFVTEFDGDLE